MKIVAAKKWDYNTDPNKPLDLIKPLSEHIHPSQSLKRGKAAEKHVNEWNSKIPERLQKAEDALDKYHGKNWFSKMSKKEQEEYKKLHPNSKYS